MLYIENVQQPECTTLADIVRTLSDGLAPSGTEITLSDPAYGDMQFTLNDLSRAIQALTQEVGELPDNLKHKPQSPEKGSRAGFEFIVELAHVRSGGTLSHSWGCTDYWAKDAWVVTDRANTCGYLVPTTLDYYRLTPPHITQNGRRVTTRYIIPEELRLW